MSKYRAKKTTVLGITFPSKKEASRYLVLRSQEQSGEISNLRLQVCFVLDEAVVINGRKRPPLRYFADFVYDRDGKQIIEDSKGFRTSVYKIKRHLMKSVHGIDIYET